MSNADFQRIWNEVKQRVSILRVVGQRVKLVSKGREHVGLCPFHNESTPSFTVYGDRFHCFGCGADGDAVTFVMESQDLDFKAAVLQLAEDLGIVASLGGERKPLAPVVDRAAGNADLERKKARIMERARNAWASRRVIDGTVVETYLRGRGLEPPYPPTLGYLPSFEYWHTPPKQSPDDEPKPYVLRRLPVMLGYIQAPDGSFAGTHVTYLHPSGETKAQLDCPHTGERLGAKKILGRPQTAAIRFSAGAHKMMIGEGIETVISVQRAMLAGAAMSQPEGDLLAGDRSIGFWAAMSIGNICGAAPQGERGPERSDRRNDDGSPLHLPSVSFDPERPGLIVPDVTREIVVLCDNDNKDPAAAAAQYERAARRWRAQGLIVRLAWPPAGMDFNDMLQAFSEPMATA